MENIIQIKRGNSDYVDNISKLEDGELLLDRDYGFLYYGKGINIYNKYPIQMPNELSVQIENGILFFNTTLLHPTAQQVPDGDIDKIVLPSSETYTIKDSQARDTLDVLSKGNLTYYIEGNSTDTAGTWTGTDNAISAYYDGLSIVYVPQVAGISGGTTLNINNLGAKACYLVQKGTKTALTTHFPLGTPIPMIFYNDEWRIADYYQADTDEDIKAYQVYTYYQRYRVNPTYALYPYCLCALNVNNQLVPLAQNGNSTDQKPAVDIPFRPEYIYFYNNSSATAAGGTTANAILYYTSSHTSSTYAFNASVPTYNTIYLCGTYNSLTGLFTLDNSSYTSWYKFVPSTAAGITPADYFTQGKDYILVGQSYSSAGRWNDALYNTTYHFDGTNLVPYKSYIPQMSTTFNDYCTSDLTSRTITRQGNWVHMSWGDTYTLSSGNWGTITSAIPAKYRPLVKERRSVPVYTSLSTWIGYALVEVNTDGTMRISGNFTGSGIIQIDMTYNVASL